MLVVEQLGALHQPRFDSLSMVAVAVFFRVFRTHLKLDIHDLVAQRVFLKRELPRSIQFVISRLFLFLYFNLTLFLNLIEIWMNLW